MNEQNKKIVVFKKSNIRLDYSNVIKQQLPHNALDMAVNDAYTFFHYEIPALESWPISPYSGLMDISALTSAFSARIKQSVLYVSTS